MVKIFKTVLLGIGLLILSQAAFAQSGHSITGVLKDADNGEAVGFATVSLTISGGTKPLKYALTNESGEIKLESVRNGNYALRIELLGYKTIIRDLTVKNASIELGEIPFEIDQQQIDAATVSAVGNPIIIKKDTIEYNASSFKTTESDVLEDLLKKLPGVEVSDNGTITVNGESISRITIDGRTFFLDDPQIASKNIPAKLVNKLKVIKKKSEQAEFTGIDDGQEENVIDLSVAPGMMRGMFGNVTAGAGHDIPAASNDAGDYRFTGNAMIGRFSDASQISVILNGNNTNGQGFNDISGGMMGGMGGMGGGMMGFGGGITTSYMGGLNIAGDLFDGKMDIGGNYVYNGSKTDSEQTSDRITYISDTEHLYNSSTGFSNSTSSGHRVGIRLEHEFSENTSIFFEPNFNFGDGTSLSESTSSTDTYNPTSKLMTRTNDSWSQNTTANKNMNAGGTFLFRQRLGIPGRTLTIMANANVSNIDMTGNNRSETNVYMNNAIVNKDIINQNFVQNTKSTSVMTTATYTEPMGNFFYLQGEYRFTWNKSASERTTFEQDGTLVPAYSNSIINENTNHSIGFNFLYQNSKLHAQIGASLLPNKSRNYTETGTAYKIDTTITVLNWSPQVMIIWNPSDYNNVRFNYRGNSQQPSTSQLISVPDNSNPLSISFGNPNLAPYFSNNFSVDYRFTNMANFSSFNIGFNGGFTTDPIVNSSWYTNGISYSMPMNGPTTLNGGFNTMINTPIAKSDFSVSNMLSANYFQSASYVGANIDTPTYVDADGALDYARFFADYNKGLLNFTENSTKTLSFNERLRTTYRSDNLEVILTGGTNYRRSWYSISTLADNTTTWNNSLGSSLNWTLPNAGLTLKADYTYNWYRGYTTPQPDEHILNASLQKLLFNNTVTLSLSAQDILGQSKNLMVSDSSNIHSETTNNTLGRYIIVGLSYRFGTFGRNRGRGMGGPGMGGPGGGPGPGMGGGMPPMGGPGMGGPGMGGGRPR